jgi:myxalamid-type nonribosomal peptide synthetase MxaA
VHQDNFAYVIYTSGSTGLPKGVMVTHRAIVNRLLWMQAEYQLSTEDRVLQKTPSSFDVSVWEFFWPLITGATLVVASPGGHRDPAHLTGAIQRERVTTVHFVPSMLRAFLDEPGAVRCTSLRTVVCSGEALSGELRDRFYALLGGSGARLHNLYGPTEAAVDVTYWACSPTETGAVPIGAPVWNTGLRVLDAGLQPVGPGAVGELYLTGVQLSRGYLNQPGRSAERFMPDPSGRPGSRMYRTGDLARWRVDGALEYLGRVDHQVKIRGFRIELGEIETTLAQHPRISAAVVVPVEDAAGDSRLVAHVVARNTPGPTAAQLTEHLARTLPEHMLPAGYVELAELPLTPSGKVDRAALRPPPADPSPRAVLEREIADGFAEVLGVGKVGRDDDFFSLGGQRLLLARFCFRLCRQYNVDLPVERLGDNATPAGIARVIDVYHTDGRDAAIAEASRPDLAAEAMVPDEITPAGLPTADIQRPRHILLTGVTGFLGAFLLHELLRRTDASVHCLVRARGDDEAWQRIERTLRGFQIWQEAYRSRIVPEAGDLEQARLGLSDERFAELAATVDVIYHSGASVNFVYPYAALKAANVDGTREVLRLACTSRAKALHHLSTVDVCAPGPDRLVREEPAARRCPVANGYIQSKWVAERMVGAVRDRGLPVAIYRPRTVLGHTRTGVTHTTDFTCVLIKGCIQLKAGPQDIPVDLMPVDFVSEAIVAISGQRSSFGQIFHFANPRPVGLSDVWRWAREFGYPIETMSYEDWLGRLAGVDADNALFPVMSLIGADVADPRGHPPDTGLRVSTVNTDTALTDTGIECPLFDRDIGWRILDHLVRVGFLEPPPRVRLSSAR